jgi:hypothetical protein
MGNYSFLRAVRNNPELCKIDWDSLEKDTILNDWCLVSAYEKRLPTMKEMAERWNETKFIGYMDALYIEALKALCKVLKPYGQNPRLYYEYEGMCQIWCIEFVPGTEEVNVAVYDYLDILDSLPKAPNYDDDLYSKWDNMYRTVEDYCQEASIDSNEWEFRAL